MQLSSAESTDQRECQKRIAKKCQRNRTTGILIAMPTRIRIQMVLVGGKN